MINPELSLSEVTILSDMVQKEILSVWAYNEPSLDAVNKIASLFRLRDKLLKMEASDEILLVNEEQLTLD